MSIKRRFTGPARDDGSAEDPPLTKDDVPQAVPRKPNVAWTCDNCGRSQGPQKRMRTLGDPPIILLCRDCVVLRSEEDIWFHCMGCKRKLRPSQAWRPQGLLEKPTPWLCTDCVHSRVPRPGYPLTTYVHLCGKYAAYPARTSRSAGTGGDVSTDSSSESEGGLVFLKEDAERKRLSVEESMSNVLAILAHAEARGEPLEVGVHQFLTTLVDMHEKLKAAEKMDAEREKMLAEQEQEEKDREGRASPGGGEPKVEWTCPRCSRKYASVHWKAYDAHECREVCCFCVNDIIATMTSQSWEDEGRKTEILAARARRGDAHLFRGSCVNCGQICQDMGGDEYCTCGDCTESYIRKMALFERAHVTSVDNPLRVKAQQFRVYAKTCWTCKTCGRRCDTHDDRWWNDRDVHECNECAGATVTTVRTQLYPKTEKEDKHTEEKAGDSEKAPSEEEDSDEEETSSEEELSEETSSSSYEEEEEEEEDSDEEESSSSSSDDDDDDGLPDPVPHGNHFTYPLVDADSGEEGGRERARSVVATVVEVDPQGEAEGASPVHPL